MNSQVRNTLTALTVSSALVLGLVVAATAAFPTAAAQAGAMATPATNANAARVSGNVTLAAEAPVVAGLAVRLQDAVPTPAKAKPVHRRSSKSSRIRQSMAMPFFSFARG